MARWTHQPFTFELTPELTKRVQEWDKCADLNHGTIGGHMSFELTPTSLGCVIKAKCNHCGEELDLTEYDW